MKLYGYLVSSRNRIKILRSMSIDAPQKSKDIASKTDLSWQTTSAELNNLLKVGIVSKIGTGYVLTEKGYFLITRISSLPSFDDWVLEDFVAHHQIHRIPPMILKDFGIWEHVSFKRMLPTDYLATERDAILACKHQYRAITPNVIKIDLSLIKDKINEIPVKFIYAKQSLDSDDARSYIEEQIDHNIQIRLVDSGQMYMHGRIIDAHEAQISFLDSTGAFDFTNYIVGDDEEFVFWCRRNFHYLWEQGVPY
jgi:predicted transcriptional regulator